MPDDTQKLNSQPSPATDGQVDQPAPSSKAPVAPQQPAAAANEQSFAPATPLSSSQAAAQKPSKWRYFFIALGVVQALGVALFFLVSLWAGNQAKAGVSGTEFIVLALFATVVPAVAIVSLVNLIGLPIYLKKHRSQGRGLIFSIVSLVISAIIAAFGIYSVYQLYAVPQKLAKEGKQKSEQRQQEFVAANAKPEITKEEAVGLLKSCKLKGFYYTNQTEEEDHGNFKFPAAESSSTGIVLVNVGGEPYRISIADRLIPELVPIAREAQKTCTSPQFWHDGAYEQYKDGKWYFGKEVVNDTKSGKTKAEAISLMQSCKVDYFIGYMGDVNIAKDENTKAWLQKAEQSTNGIEISENAPKTYVFVSKAMTAELQNAARQARQSCYNTKKLYIMVDDWVETEYPAGSWTRVKQ